MTPPSQSLSLQRWSRSTALRRVRVAEQVVRRLAGRELLAFWSVLLLLATPLAAQESWEYSPYRILVWYAATPATALPQGHRANFAERVLHRAEVAEGAAWSLEFVETPTDLASDQVIDETLLSTDVLETADPSIFGRDKLLFLTIDRQEQRFLVRAREFDCRMQLLGPPIERQTTQLSLLPQEAIAALRTAFAATVRIESGVANRLDVRLRAGGLITVPNSCAALELGDILRPVIRQNDRVGNPLRIESVAWTYLQVTERDPSNPNLLKVQVHSGYRNPIRGRVASTREQFGIAVRPTLASTRVVVEAKVRRGETPYPLKGLELFMRAPGDMKSPDGADENGRAAPELIGYTDWQGAIEVPATEAPLQIAYIKSGGQLLARLPIVAGIQRVLRAQVADDELRLEAETNIKGFNAQITDLVAQRRILATQFRRKLADNRIAEAEAILDRFTQLPTRSDMRRRLDQRTNRDSVSANPQVQVRIDQLHAGTVRTLGKYLDPNLQTQLLRELNAANVQPVISQEESQRPQ